MIKYALTVLLISLTSMGYSQYYYQDIVSLHNTRTNFQLLKANQIKTATAQSIEPDGSQTEGFEILQKTDFLKNTLSTTTRSSFSAASTLITTFNKLGLPVAGFDSSLNGVNEITYTYNDKNLLKSLFIKSYEPADTNKYIITEQHLFEYKPNGQLLRMFRIKQSMDTAIVTFTYDEGGHPAVETWWKDGRKQETWYYYHDDAGRLTDVVRFNRANNKMIPDYVFAYNDVGQLEQQTIVQAGTNFYRVWYYEYLDNGLKKAESIFNKGKEQEGRIIYQYQ